MNAPRKNKVVTGPSSADAMDGWVGVLRRQLNNVLTAILVIAAIVMFVRWRMKTAEMNKQAVADELAGARSLVMQLQNYPSGSSADVIKAIQLRQTSAESTISNVLNSSDATAAIRGQALVLRGDLYWHLANLPEMPGSASEASLRLSETPDVLLQKSFDAYSEVVKNSTYSDQYESLNAAHLGLGVIAENRGDWKTAASEFRAVVDDNNALAVLRDQAKFQLIVMPTLQKPLYVAPVSGTGPATMPVASGLLEPTGQLPVLGSPTTLPSVIGPTIKAVVSAATTQALKYPSRL